MTGDYYILFGQEIIPCDVFTWMRWHQITDHVICRDRIGDVLVSTIFFGLNRRSDPNSPQLIFETMVFGGAFGEYRECYETYSEAEAGHQRVISMIIDDGILDAEFIGTSSDY